MSNINIVASTSESTVVSEYSPDIKNRTAYQGEAELEKQFIETLCKQGYTYLDFHDEESLIINLRKQIEKLNDYTFTEKEWKWLFDNVIANPNNGIPEKTKFIQEDYVQVLPKEIRDGGLAKNIYLINKENIYANSLQVINQYVNNSGARDNRYDVTILVNGFPLVHVELKRRGVALKEAFNQINRYQNDSFWSGCGLFQFVQVFVISNGTHTKYYSNTTREKSIKERKTPLPGSIGKKTSDSFEFTSYWADAKNRPITDLIDFTKTFLTKSTLLNVLTKYCVFTSEKMLLVMRPYQIVATERILKRIEIAHNYKQQGTIDAGGYIWHTTGSGKTLTSFKTAQLATKFDFIDKVLFVVDRKDLDYQTMKEYDRFEKGAANGNVSTKILKRQLEDVDSKGNHHEYKIIVTTIQKLDSFIRSNPTHPIYDKNIVMIFDECHRSQFGEMHIKIAGINGDSRKKGIFKNYYIFGFTGTPIFAANSSSANGVLTRTTEQVFGERLHTYTIVNAINDENVLPFRIDYMSTMRPEDEDKIEDKQVKAIDREKAYMDPKRIAFVVNYILQHFAQKTKRGDRLFAFNKLMNIEEVANAKQGKEVAEVKQSIKMRGFNSIFATSSIDAAKLYYSEFKKEMAARPDLSLKVGLIYSYGVNGDDESDEFLADESSDDTDGLNASDRNFLESAIKDYNAMFGTSYDTSADKFPNYYKDVSLRMKNRELDILIVVNMFLTGFDATTLNTLWVDKNLKQHGLLQAFSRTNRILNSVKTFGNIICFRKRLKKETDDAISLFGDKDAGGIVILKPFDDYFNGYDDDKGHHPGYSELLDELNKKYPFGSQIIGEENEKAFIKLFSALLRLRNILTAFDEFDAKDTLSPFLLQNYTSEYLDLHDKWRPKDDEGKESINDDIVFEMELIQQIEVNIDYILMMVQKLHDSHTSNKVIMSDIEGSIDASTQLRSKKLLIMEFVGNLSDGPLVDEQWHDYVKDKKEKELSLIISDEHLKNDKTRQFVDDSFKDGYVKTTGTDIDGIMPPISRFGNEDRDKKKARIIDRIIGFFEKYFGLI